MSAAEPFPRCCSCFAASRTRRLTVAERPWRWPSGSPIPSRWCWRNGPSAMFICCGASPMRVAAGRKRSCAGKEVCPAASASPRASSNSAGRSPNRGIWRRASTAMLEGLAAISATGAEMGSNISCASWRWRAAEWSGERGACPGGQGPGCRGETGREYQLPELHRARGNLLLRQDRRRHPRRRLASPKPFRSRASRREVSRTASGPSLAALSTRQGARRGSRPARPCLRLVHRRP